MEENRNHKEGTKSQCTESQSTGNECIILKALQEARGDRTVVLVSHRASTMNLADVVVKMRTLM